MLFHEKGYRVVASCPGASGPEINFQTDGPGFLLIQTVSGDPLSPSSGASAPDAARINISASFSANGFGQVISSEASGRVVVIDFLTDAGIRGRDCAFDGVLTVVGSNERFRHSFPQLGSAQVLSRFGLNVVAHCDDAGDTSLTASSTKSVNAFATTFLIYPPKELAFFPLGGSTYISSGTGPSISDLNLVTPAGRVTSAAVGVDADGSQCQGAGRARSAARGKARVLYAKDAAAHPKRTEFYDHGGLRLSAKCASGQLKVFAATSIKHAIFRTSVLGDGDASLVRYDDFSSKPAKPQFILDLQSIHRSGQIVYARPDGHATTLHWSAADGSGFRDCLFYGIASSA
jgi:hypothetical protein